MIAHDGPFFQPSAYRAMQTVTGEPGGSEDGGRRINSPPAPAPKTSIGLEFVEAIADENHLPRWLGTIVRDPEESRAI